MDSRRTAHAFPAKEDVRRDSPHERCRRSFSSSQGAVNRPREKKNVQDVHDYLQGGCVPDGPSFCNLIEQPIATGRRRSHPQLARRMTHPRKEYEMNACPHEPVTYTTPPGRYKVCFEGMPGFVLPAGDPREVWVSFPWNWKAPFLVYLSIVFAILR